jgi:hypothetical protein
LKTIDRRIDRMRSSKRMLTVYSKAHGIRDFKEAIAFFQSSIASFQNLSRDERAVLSSKVEAISKDESLDERLKLMQVCFLFMDITGEDNFQEIMERLEDYLEDSSRRLRLVYELCEDIPDSIGAMEVLTVSLAAFPTISTDEKTELVRIIESIKISDMAPRLKLVAVALGLINILGENALKHTMEMVRIYETKQAESGAREPGRAGEATPSLPKPLMDEAADGRSSGRA